MAKRKVDIMKVCMWIMAAVLVGITLLGLVGCSSIGGLFKPKNTFSPPYVLDEGGRIPTSQPAAEWPEWWRRLAVGAGASGQNVTQHDPGDVKLPAKGGGSVDDAGTTVKPAAETKTGPRLLAVYIIGGFVLAAGVLVAIYVNLQLGLLIAGSAVAAVGAIQFIATHPWVLWIAGALGIVFLGYVVWRAKKQGDGQITLQTLVGAISTLDDDLAAVVKAAIAKYAGRNADTVKDVISESKRDENVT